jgi:hypothetical protein
MMMTESQNILKSRGTRTVIVLLLFYAVLAGRFAILHQIGTYGVETDFYGLYAPDVLRLLNGEAVQERDHGPGYTLLALPVTAMLGDVFSAAKLLSYLSYLITLIFSFLLFRLLLGRETALAAVLFTGSILLPYSFIATIDIVFTAFCILSIWVLLKYFTDQKRRFLFLAIAGVLSGFTTLIRYNGLLLLIGGLFGILILNGEKQLWNRIRHAVVYAIFFFLPILPWEVWLATVEKNVSSPGLSQALAWEYYGPGGRFDGDQRMAVVENRVDLRYSSFGEYLRHEPFHFILHYGKNVLTYISDLYDAFLPFPAAHLSFVGLFVLLLAGSKWAIFPLAFPLVGYLGAALVHFYSRYFLITVPFLALGVGIFFFHDRLKPLWNTNRLSRWMVFGLFVLTFANVFRINFVKARETIRAEPLHLVHIAQELKERAGKDDILLSRKPHLAFLAGLRYRYFPPLKDVESVVRFMRRENIRFLLYGDVEASFRKELRDFMTPDSVRIFFWPVVIDSASKTIVYQLKEDIGGVQ